MIRDCASGLIGEARLSCTYRCISPACYEEIYAKDEVCELVLARAFDNGMVAARGGRG